MRNTSRRNRLSTISGTRLSRAIRLDLVLNMSYERRIELSFREILTLSVVSDVLVETHNGRLIQVLVVKGPEVPYPSSALGVGE